MCDPHPVPPGRADTEAAPSPSPGAGVGVACGRGTWRSRDLPSEHFVSPWDREGQEGPANKRVNDEMERDARLSAKTGTVPNWHHGLRASSLCCSDFHSRHCRSCSPAPSPEAGRPEETGAPANHGPGCLSASPGALSRKHPLPAAHGARRYLSFPSDPSHGRAKETAFQPRARLPNLPAQGCITHNRPRWGGVSAGPGLPGRPRTRSAWHGTGDRSPRRCSGHGLSASPAMPAPSRRVADSAGMPRTRPALVALCAGGAPGLRVLRPLSPPGPRPPA